jgi:cellulose synthase/poly-beta-1,6-N-acetylglucosamine synthase-like glycosyltransferase
MWNDWIHWLTSLPADQLFWLLLPILLLDAPRYAFGSLAVWVWDCVDGLANLFRGRSNIERLRHCPSVCAVVAGLNEADTLEATLHSLWGSYPRLHIVVVDDGSSDGMSDVACAFARQHAGVVVVCKPRRGGKSSALNCALPFTEAEILVCVDSDSQLGEEAIWEIVQPFADARVGAVSGSVIGRNPFNNLMTWLQAFEYLRCIFVGRMLTSRLGILGIISGAFGAYRREAVERMLGWDVGPGEDGDMTLRLRKAGYKIVFAPYAQCYTNLLTSLPRLLRQRRRWDWAVVTFECRKHVDMANIFSPNFRFSNLCMLMDRWLYNILLQYLFWAYLVWCLSHLHEHTGKQFFLYYLVYLALELVQLGVILFYARDRVRVLAIGLVAPLMPIYYLMLRLVTLLAVSEELLTRRSFRDTFVPRHVRDATWHW